MRGTTTWGWASARPRPALGLRASGSLSLDHGTHRNSSTLSLVRPPQALPSAPTAGDEEEGRPPALPPTRRRTCASWEIPRLLRAIESGVWRKRIGLSVVHPCPVLGPLLPRARAATEWLLMIQAMASQAGGGGGGGDAGSAQRGQAQGLGRQGSLYNLTLNEVQSHLGEPLMSMNFDELLKSVFPDGVDPDGAVAGNLDWTSGLQRQGSITMPPQLSKKTVDEVWKGIQNGPDVSAEEGGRQRRERQPTLGEMTLEDFLVKARVVTEGFVKDSDGLPGNTGAVGSSVGNMGAVGSSVVAAGASSLKPGVQWLQKYQRQALEPQQPSMAGPYMAGQLAPKPLSVAKGAIFDSIYSDGQITAPTLGALSDPQTPGHKRGATDEFADKMIERRQKRMIKNRESAARSRARKQAYTNELENKVSRLEEENERLKKQKELDEILSSAPPLEPKHILRRTSSAAF